MGERLLYLPAVAFALTAAALAYRFVPRRAPIVLGALLLLYTGRTLARNSAWDGAFSLASADVPTSPRSARLREALAKALFERDERGNIDAVIAEQESACAIVAPLPPVLSSELPQAHLGIYYAIKAGQLGKDRRRQWYERSIAALLRAREIAEVQAKAFDAAQAAHGKPLSKLPSFQLLYFYLANDYAVLGRYPEALEAARYGMGIDPRFTDGYDALSGLYLAAGRPRDAAVALLEKAQVDGFHPATLRALQQVYGTVPDAACAFTDRQLNLGCPRVRADVCEAAGALAEWYTQARAPADAEVARRTAAERYGCPPRP
jgi:tetratricopeptide (TPR) repeat protein